MVSERVLLSYQDDMMVQVIRPATVCGISPRMRLDVAVNLLTMRALEKGKITVFGGNQARPNIHMDDITDVYLHFMDHPKHTGVFNAGFENITILDIANLITKYIPVEIAVTESNDPRSYRINSDKLLATGFKPKKTVEHAIQEIIESYRSGVLKMKTVLQSQLDAEDESCGGMTMDTVKDLESFCAGYADKLSHVLASADWSNDQLGKDIRECWLAGRQVFFCGNGGSGQCNSSRQ